MSDKGERTCPLCAEEMDLTDQQLKPCKCGYDICVWCWHHIMDMAEKDNTEGRCPACRTPYNKEKIVGTASKCERLVTGMSVEKKQKSQKGKIKTSEGRKDLGSVRVIQRNLVYIVGLPLDLADEDLLQQKDYFGQYGKVLKVSISRTAAGAIQQFPNSTCSVYITYSKEEEAVRSIQSTHGYILEGCPLRACFGTTKYCHAWLRNMPCTNVDCLYLHEFGLQEDSFTKDEIVSAYTRNRVQQITGATNDMQRRSGNLLPPPADDYSNNNTSTWPKPISKITPNNPANSMKVSPPNSSSERSVALPAAASWGTHSSNSQPIVANMANVNGPTKQQTKACNTTLSFSSAVVSPFHGDDLVNKHSEESNNTVQDKGNLGNLVSMKKVVGQDHRRTLSETPVTTTLPSSLTSSSLISTTTLKNKNVSGNQGRIQNLSFDMSSESTTKSQRLQPSEDSQFVEPLTTNEAENTTIHAVNISVTRKQSDLVSDLQKKVAEIAISEANEDFMSFNDTEVTHTSYIQNPPHISPQHTYVSDNGNLDPPSLDQNLETPPQHAFNISNGHSYFHGTEGGRSQQEMLKDHSTAALDLGENSIISNILSMDFDPWDESLTSPQNLAKFLGESDKQVLSSSKTQNSNQSRFSFAREDECTEQRSNYAPNLSDFRQGVEYNKYNNSIYQDNKLSGGNGFSSFSFEESNHFATNYSHMPENKISVPKAQVSAPPGFSGPNRAPPPGFTSHERMEQTFDNISGNHMFNTSSLLRKTHETAAPVNMGDLEFMDPAILAVGGRVPNGLDMRSNFPSHMNSFENNIRLQLLMQTSFSQQNPRFTQLGDSYHQQPNFSSYQQQTSFQQPMSSLMSNGYWNGENDIGMADLLRNERMGFNRYYSGHEDTKFQLPTSGDLYNRTFGI